MKLDRPVLTNGTDLKADGDKIIVGTAIFGGNTLVDTEFEGDGPYLGGDPAQVVRGGAEWWRRGRGRRGRHARRRACR